MATINGFDATIGDVLGADTRGTLGIRGTLATIDQFGYADGYSAGHAVGYAAGLLAATPDYRMRAMDQTLGRLVFWTTSSVDAAGAFYLGPGPISDVVVQKIIGNASGVVVSGSGVRSMPEQWVKLNVPANQSLTAMNALVSTNFDTVKAIRSGSIVGLGTRLSEAITSGTLTVRVSINGVAGTLTATHTSGTGTQVVQAEGVDAYLSGDLIGVQYSTSAGFAPVTTDLEAWLQTVEAS